MKFIKLSLSGLLILNTSTSLHGLTPKEQENAFAKFALCELGSNKKVDCKDYLAFLELLQSDQSGKRYENLEELNAIKAACMALVKAIVKKNWITSSLTAEQIKLLQSMIENGSIKYANTAQNNLNVFNNEMQRRLKIEKDKQEAAKKTKKQQDADAALKAEIERFSRSNN